MTAAVEVKGLRKTFRVGFRRRKVSALSGTDFRVEPGETVGLIGPNGAGKTTTIKILTGLTRPDSGDARLFGDPAGAASSRRLLGYLPESPYFYEHLTADEALRFYGNLFGLDHAVLAKRVPQLLERVGLEHAAHRPIKRYSKGMRQRVGLAQALINDPKLVILDEPQSGLDPVGRKEVRDLIRDLHEEGRTVLFSSHILGDVEAVCDRVVALVDGKIVAEGPVDSLFDAPPAPPQIVLRDAAKVRDAALSGVWRVHERGEFLVLDLEEGGDVDAVLDAAMKLGARVHSVTPTKPDLERIFTGEAKK